MTTSNEKPTEKISRLRSKKAPEAFTDSNATEDAEIRHLFQDIVQEVTYPSFQHLPVETFTQLRRLATLDLFFDASDEDKARWTETDRDDLGRCRRTKDYKTLRTAVLEAFDKVTTPRSFRDHVGDTSVQDRLFRSMRRVALHAVDPKWATKAQAELVERVAPRAQPGQQAVIVQIHSDQAKLIAESLKQIEGDVIDGEYSHVQPPEADGVAGEGET